MDLIKIDDIETQPAQAVLALATNGIRRQRAMNVSLFVPPQTAFGKNVRPRSRPGPQRKSDDFLGVPHAINGRSVDPVNAQLERAMNRGDRRFVVLLAPTKFPARSANSPGAKADGSDEQVGVTELLRFHL